MDLEIIFCVCKKKFNKTEFKKHHKNCNAFKNKFYDFDLRIGQLLKEYLLVKENSSIIKFLFQRYIKLIDHKFKPPENAKIKAIRKNKKNKIQFNLEMNNESHNQEFYDSNNNNNNDNDLKIYKEFSTKLSFRGDGQNNNTSNINNNFYRNQQNSNFNRYQQISNFNRYQQNSNFNRYQQNNNINRFQQNNNNSFDLSLNYNNMIRSSPIQYNNLFNIQYQQYNNFGQDINKSSTFNNNQNINLFEQGYNSYNDIYSSVSKNSNNNIGGNQKIYIVGSKFGEDERKIIMNFCRDEYRKFEGKCNSKMIETIGKHINKVYSEHKWFILIYNSEYSDIQYNLSQTLPERYMNFSLGKLIFNIKEYK